ncbi:MAG: pinensin family lanthipeptide [Cyclobacteriaceae bacterium]
MKKKLSLDDLEVKSFVTGCDKKKRETDDLKGGTINLPGDQHTFNDYSCWWGGGCGTQRCHETQGANGEACTQTGCAEPYHYCP